MNISPAQPRLPRPVVPAILACACLVLAGCSSRDELLAEKVAAAEAAAQRAESAAVRAENAARRAAPSVRPAQTAAVQPDDEPGVEDTVVEHDPNEPSNPAVANNPQLAPG